MSWSISVKTVGGANIPKKGDTNASRDFTIHVQPDDTVTSMHEQIANITGLTPSQQRLIYRGRLISSTTNNTMKDDSNVESTTNDAASLGNQSRIRDVDGLSDGQTIHLVPKRAESTAATAATGTSHSTIGNDPASSSSESNTTNRGSSTNNVNNTSNNDAASTSSSTDDGTNLLSSSSPGAGLIAALLGLGSNTSQDSVDDDDDDDDEDTDDADMEAIFSTPTMRRVSAAAAAQRNGTSRRRLANAHRRQASDPRYPDPIPLEPVRQSLMTLHTMLGSEPMNVRGRELRRNGHLRTRREWYKGQWVDCRDTVNQWLESTIVEVLSPDEILITDKEEEEHQDQKQESQSSSTTYIPAADPAIGANDVEGRRKLLLEQSDNEYDDKLATLNDEPTLTGYRERPNNDGIQLLLIHYNGWPNRWDEWIRSDSERIRPFRTRSRHQPLRNTLCPTPNSRFDDAPPTHIQSEDDEIDKYALIPELSRSLSSVQELFASTIFSMEEDSLGSGGLSLEQQLDLATSVNQKQAERLTKIRNIVNSRSWKDGSSSSSDDHHNNHSHNNNGNDLSHLDDVSRQRIRGLLRENREDMEEQRYQNLSSRQLPWKKNKSTDVDDIDDDDDVDQTDEEHNEQMKKLFDKHKLEAVAPLLDRLGRALIDAAPHVASIADVLPESKEEEEEDRKPSQTSLASGNNRLGLTTIEEDSASAPLLSTPASSTTQQQQIEEEEEEDDEEETVLNPDYVDFVNGFINTNRGEVVGRRGLRRGGSPPDGTLGSSLFSAFLASGAGGGGSVSTAGSDDGSRNSAGGPRMVRIGGNGGGLGGMVAGGGGGGGGGIDIHIHAIVTGGGGPPTGIGIDGLGGLFGGGPPTPVIMNPGTMSSSNNTGNMSSTRVVRPSNDDEDDLGLFSDLYSDNPRVSSSSSAEENLNNIWNNNTEEEAEIQEEDELEESSIGIDDDDTDDDEDYMDLPPLLDDPDSSDDSSSDSDSEDESLDDDDDDNNSIPPLAYETDRNRRAEPVSIEAPPPAASIPSPPSPPLLITRPSTASSAVTLPSSFPNSTSTPAPNRTRSRTSSSGGSGRRDIVRTNSGESRRNSGFGRLFRRVLRRGNGSGSPS